MLLREGNFFGSEELVNSIPRKYNVRCLSAEGSLYEISEIDFFKIIYANEFNKKFFAEHSEEINNFVKERFDLFTEKFEKELLKKYKKQEKNFSFLNSKNEEYEIDCNKEEIDLFFSNEIMKNKEKHIMKIFKKTNQNSLQNSIPKLFEHELKENAKLLRKGIISKMKFNKKKEESMISQMLLNEQQKIQKISEKKKINIEFPSNSPKMQNKYIIPRHFSLGKTIEKEFYFQNNLHQTGLNSSKSRGKTSNSLSKESDLSNLMITTTRSFFHNKYYYKPDDSRKKLEKMLKNKKIENSSDEPYGLKSFLPLKYKSDEIRASKDSKKNDKIKKILSNSLIKRKIILNDYSIN